MFENHQADEREVVRLGIADLGRAERGRERLGTAQHVFHVGMPGDRPESGSGRPVVHLVLGLPGHRCLVTQQPERLVWHATGKHTEIEDVDRLDTGLVTAFTE